MRVALALLAAGCNLFTNFDASRYNESNDSLCDDGVDNDSDGLTDCQDWKCLDRKPCCTLPKVLFHETFDSAACAAADCAMPQCPALADADWQPWGLPDPVICQGALRPWKAQQCYDVGAMLRLPLPLHPGLGVSAQVVGAPEQAGRLSIGFTLQDRVVGGSFICEPLEPVTPFAVAQLVRSAEGSQITARFGGSVLGTSKMLDAGPHQIRLSVDRDRHLQFFVDEELLGASDELPDPEVQAHLVLFGRGLETGFRELQVTDGTQCEAPGSWQASSGVALAGVSDNGRSWDSFQVSDPSLVPATQMIYHGCGSGTSDNECSTPTGLGLATVGARGELTRGGGAPFFLDVSRVNFEAGMLREDGEVTVQRGYVTAADSGSGARKFIQTFTLSGPQLAFELGPHVLESGSAGSWDDGSICCASAVRHGGKVLLYYAGRKNGDPTWRIGLAVSDDGIQFQRFAGNPLLGPSGADFDAAGVRDPEVLWDPARGLYRMWYAGSGILGQKSLSYAVSTDGSSWHLYPHNPVVTQEQTGLGYLGSPAVMKLASGFRMWLHGTEGGRIGLRIYTLDNEGTPSR